MWCDSMGLPFMDNKKLYEEGILLRFLDESAMPKVVKEFIHSELALLDEIVKEGSSLIDIGCGFGRNLKFLLDKISLGVGVDIAKPYIDRAMQELNDSKIRFFCQDIRDFHLDSSPDYFDYVICMNNTFGNFPDSQVVIKKINELLKDDGTAIVSVYSANSLSARVEWYENIGLEVSEVTGDLIKTKEGFSSKHFSREQLRELFPEAEIRPLTDFGYAVIAQPLV